MGHIAPKDFANCVAVNLTATYRLIRTCGPVLVAADAGRAVFVTSSVARTPRAYWGSYAATKAGMENLVLTWADEVEGKNLRVNLFNPGRTATRMRANAFPGEGPEHPAATGGYRAAPGRLCACPRKRGHGELVGVARH